MNNEPQRIFRPRSQIRCISRIERDGTSPGFLVEGMVYIVNSAWRMSFEDEGKQDISLLGVNFWQAAENFELINPEDSLDAMYDNVVALRASRFEGSFLRISA